MMMASKDVVAATAASSNNASDNSNTIKDRLLAKLKNIGSNNKPIKIENTHMALDLIGRGPSPAPPTEPPKQQRDRAPRSVVETQQAMGWVEQPLDQNLPTWEELSESEKRDILANNENWFDAGGLAPASIPSTHDRGREEGPLGHQVKWTAASGVDLGVVDLTTVNGPAWNMCPMPPMDQRNNGPAKEPIIGDMLEFYEGHIYHYAIYIGQGKSIGVHSPQAAFTIARITIHPIVAWWRVCYTPNAEQRLTYDQLKELENEPWPYAAVTNNCYEFCCQVMGVQDSWLERRLVTSGRFNHPTQDWSKDTPDFQQDSKLEIVRDAVLAAINGLVSKPFKDLLGKLKPLNVLNLLSNCDWTFMGVVETVILLMELFGVFWNPPDVSSFIASLLPDMHLQGPEDLAKDLIPLVLGGIGLAIGFTKDKVTKVMKSAVEGLRAATQLGQYGLEIFAVLKKYFFGGDQTEKTLKDIEAAVIDMEVISATAITQLVRDKQSARTYMAILDAEEEKARKLSVKHADPHVVSTTNALIARISLARSALAKAQAEMTNRVKPVVIMMCGPPGIGKTKAAEYLAKRLANEIRPGGKVGLVPREAVDHWDGYHGEEVMLWDDYGMSKIADDCNKLQAIADTAPLTLNCDRIEKKGLQFVSDAIVITTNAPGPAPVDFVNLGPVCRRVDFLVYCSAPDVEQTRRTNPGDTGALKDCFKSDFSHLKMELAPQGGFDNQGNTPFGKGTMRPTTLNRLLIQAVALTMERQDEFQMQGPTYDFDADRISAFTSLARANGLGLIDMAKLGKRLRSVDSIHGLKNALSGYSITPCSIKWQARIYDIESDGTTVKIKENTAAQSQQQHSIDTAVLALTRLRAARAAAYASCLQSAITTILQMAGSALVIHRAVKRMFGTHSSTISLEGPTREHQCRAHVAKANGGGPIGHDDVIDKYGLCETEEEEDTQEVKVCLPTAIQEGKNKGKTKKGRGRRANYNAFSRRGLSDEEYEEYKKIREEKNGNYSIQEYLEDRQRYEEEMAEVQAGGDGGIGETEMEIRHRVFYKSKSRKNRQEERHQLGLVTGSDIRKRKPIDWTPPKNEWADDNREVDYNEKINFEAPPTLWSRVVKFGSGWGFWVSPTVFITTTHVIPSGAKEFFGEPIDSIAIHRAGEFTQLRFSKKIRPDLTGMVLEEGCPEGVVCSILIKRDSGELLPLAVRMGAIASMKIQGRLVHGQSGMLLTGANAKGMDLGTIPGDCGAPYVYKRNNDWVVCGVHAAATKSGNTVVCAVQAGEGETTLEGGDKGHYAGHEIIKHSKGPALSSKTKFWRSTTEPLPPGVYEPAYLGGRDPRVKGGPSLQQVLRDQLKPFAEPRGRMPEPGLLEAAVETVTSVLEQVMDTPVPWSYADACQSLDKTTSSGHPYHKRKNDDWNGTTFIGELGEQAAHANNMYEQGKSMKPLYTAALKDELVKPEKVYQKIKKRLLWGADLSTVIRAARAFGPFCDAIKPHVIKLPIKVGMNSIEDGPMIYAEHARFKNHFDADYSAWDSTQNRQIMTESFSIMCRLTATPELASVVAKDLLAPSEMDVGDYIIRVKEGLPSGFPCTSQVNSINHWLITLCALSEVTGLSPDVIQSQSYFSFYGDDEIVSTDIDFDPSRLTQVLKEYGLRPTRPDKSEGPIVLRRQIDGLVFLRRTISKDAAGFQGRLDRGSIERQLWWTRGPNHDDPNETLIPHPQRKVQLISLLGEASLHGEKFYRKIAGKVIQEIKTGGLEMYVPGWQAMFRWMRFHDLGLWTGDRNLLPEFVNDDGV
ncbi:polyprotein [Norwalk-like virus]|uniref:Polyprotein n=20 Tax=Norwalk virus TaxID=11983 RepID=Q8JXJ1_NORV|nr:polyprotein [Norwalk-like virus]